jgi:drug/metabolite transporter (DMT)-like permease
MAPEAGAAARSATTGVLLALASVLAFALGPASAKLAFDAGSNALTIVALRCTGGTLLLVFLLLWWRGRIRLDSQALGWCLVSGACYAVTIYCFIAALGHTSVSVAILIFFLHPLLIALIAHARGTERLTPVKLLLALGTLVALGLALDPVSLRVDRAGVAYAGLSAVAMSGMVLCSARANEHATSIQVSLWVNALSAAIFATLASLAGAWVLPKDLTGWGGIAGTTLALGLGLLLFFAALRHLSPVRATMLTNVEPLLSILVAALLLGEHLSTTQWTGVASVIGGLIMFEAASRRQTVRQRVDWGH